MARHGGRGRGGVVGGVVGMCKVGGLSCWSLVMSERMVHNLSITLNPKP